MGNSESRNKATRQKDRETAQPAIYLERVVHLGLYLILLTPLLVWSGFLMPDLTAKVLGFQVLVELVLAAALILIFLERPFPEKKPNLVLSPVFVALAAFLGYSLLSALFGTDLNLSLWGFIERQDGFVLLLHLFAWAAVAAWFFTRSDRNAGRGDRLHARLPVSPGSCSYLFCSFWVSAAVALAALRESGVKFDGILNPLLQVLSSPTRLGGVFGSPMMLGPYLLCHFFFGLYFLLTVMGAGSARTSGEDTKREQLLRKIVRYAAFIGVAGAELLILIVILAGQTRGVILGLTIGLFCSSILLVFGRSTRRAIRAAVAAGILCLVLASALTWHYRDSSLVNRIPVLQRLTHISTEESLTTFTRLRSWGAGLRALGDHPLFGWGYDNVYYALNKYYDPRLIRVTPFVATSAETWFDKSHNFFVDLIVERGLIGFLGYCLLLWIIARSLWRMTDRRLTICLGGGLVAYLVSNAFAFDVFGSLFGFFLSLAVIASVCDLETPVWIRSLFDRKRNVSKARENQLIQAKPKPLLKIFLVLAALAAGVYLQVEIAIANHRCMQAKVTFLQDPAVGVSFCLDAFEHFSPYNARQKLDCASLLVNSAITKRKASQSFNAGSLVIRFTQEALAAHPQDADYYITLNDLFNGLAFYTNRDLAKDAEVFGEKALELSPKRQEAMYHLGQTLLILDKSSQAVELYRRMLQYADFPLGRWVLGLSLLQDKQPDEAKKEIRTAIKTGYQPTAGDITTLRRFISEKEASELTAGK